MAESMNIEAKKITDKMIQDAEKLNIEAFQLENNTTVIDCGVNVAGSIKIK